jgi:Electron transfer DM13
MKTRLLVSSALVLIVAVLLLPAGAMSAVLYKGTFGPAGTHRGKGTVTVVSGKQGARVLKLSRDFAAFNAVTLHLWLATNPSGATKRDLGFMRARGAQAFTVPKGLNLGRYRWVIAWCVDFNTPITDAALLRA